MFISLKWIGGEFSAFVVGLRETFSNLITIFQWE